MFSKPGNATRILIRMALPTRVIVELSGPEALVLWDFLFRCSDEGHGDYRVAEHSAEERVLWELEKRIQPQINEIILDNAKYDQDVANARAAIREAFADSD